MRKIDHHHCSGVPCDICGPDPRDAEIARLKAEVERLTSDGYIPMIQAEVNRQERVITALESALRQHEERYGVDGLIKSHIEAATIDHRHETGKLLAEIAALKAEVARQHADNLMLTKAGRALLFDRFVSAEQRLNEAHAEIAALTRALAAGPAALRSNRLIVAASEREPVARAVEAAQEAAMKGVQ